MTNIKKSLALLCVAAPLAVLAATPDKGTNAGVALSTTSTDNLFTNTVIAKGKGVSISRNQLDDEIIRTKAVIAAQGKNISPEEMPMMEEQVLDKLVSQQLVMTKATSADRAKGKEDFEKTIAKIKTNAKITEEQYNTRLNQQLRLLNLSKEEWEKQNTEQAAIPVVLARELNVSISDDEVKKFYTENAAKFEQPESVRAAHILLATGDPATQADLSDAKKAEKKKQIEAILKRAKGGEDFAKLAKEFSEDPGSKDNGGEYTFPRGQMVPAFEEAAFSQGTNQISDVITTQFGYHIVKTFEKFPAKKIEFEKVSSDIKDYLTQQALQQKVPDYLAKLRKDAAVEILDEKLKAAGAAREKLMESMKESDLATPAVPKPSDKK